MSEHGEAGYADRAGSRPQPPARAFPFLLSDDEACMVTASRLLRREQVPPL